MGRKKTRQIYVGGYNKEFFVDEMTLDHLTNTISHIETKVENLKGASGRLGRGLSDNMQDIILCLRADQDMLLAEVETRTDCIDNC